MTRTRGDGFAASILAANLVNTRTERLPLSTKPGPLLRLHGLSFCPAHGGQLSGVAPPEGMDGVEIFHAGKRLQDAGAKHQRPESLFLWRYDRFEEHSRARLRRAHDGPRVRMKYVTDRPFANPEAAARKLLEIVLAKDIDVGQHAGVTNTAFLQAGGDVAEYLAGRDFGIAQGWFEVGQVPGSSCCSRVRISKQHHGIPRPPIQRDPGPRYRVEMVGPGPRRPHQIRQGGEPCGRRQSRAARDRQGIGVKNAALAASG
jgi:hypothetical protein